MLDLWYIKALAFLVAYVGMEGMAWFTHKYIMHGFLWFLHDDHHYKEHYGFWERNDFFFLIFAIPGIICIFTSHHSMNAIFWLGIGITAYGLTYFLVHDVFIHQRIRWFKRTESVYLRAIRKAHKVHHKHLTKHHGECFGMLWVPRRYFREARNSINK